MKISERIIGKNLTHLIAYSTELGQEVRCGDLEKLLQRDYVRDATKNLSINNFSATFFTLSGSFLLMLLSWVLISVSFLELFGFYDEPEVFFAWFFTGGLLDAFYHATMVLMLAKGYPLGIKFLKWQYIFLLISLFALYGYCLYMATFLTIETKYAVNIIITTVLLFSSRVILGARIIREGIYWCIHQRASRALDRLIIKNNKSFKMNKKKTKRLRRKFYPNQ